jgi:hypothetical protein
MKYFVQRDSGKGTCPIHHTVGSWRQVPLPRVPTTGKICPTRASVHHACPRNMIYGNSLDIHSSSPRQRLQNQSGLYQIVSLGRGIFVFLSRMTRTSSTNNGLVQVKCLLVWYMIKFCKNLQTFATKFLICLLNRIVPWRWRYRFLQTLIYF